MVNVHVGTILIWGVSGWQTVMQQNSTEALHLFVMIFIIVIYFLLELLLLLLLLSYVYVDLVSLRHSGSANVCVFMCVC